MKTTFLKTTALLSALAVTACLGTVTVMAAESGTEQAQDASSYGYLAGSQRSANRRVQFETAASLTTDEQRTAFYAAQDIGGGVYSSQQHLDAGELVQAGVIDQATADRISAYAAQEHTDIHGRFEGISGLTPQERRARFESFACGGSSGDSVDELLSAGIITQAQSNAIQQYLSE